MLFHVSILFFEIYSDQQELHQINFHYEVIHTLSSSLNFLKTAAICLGYIVSHQWHPTLLTCHDSRQSYCHLQSTVTNIFPCHNKMLLFCSKYLSFCFQAKSSDNTFDGPESLKKLLNSA